MLTPTPYIRRVLPKVMVIFFGENFDYKKSDFLHLIFFICDEMLLEYHFQLVLLQDFFKVNYLLNR